VLREDRAAGNSCTSVTGGTTGRWGKLNNCNIVFPAVRTIVRLVKSRIGDIMAQKMYHGNSRRLRGVHNLFEHLREKPVWETWSQMEGQY